MSSDNILLNCKSGDFLLIVKEKEDFYTFILNIRHALFND